SMAVQRMMGSGTYVLCALAAIFGIGGLVVLVFGGKSDSNSLVGVWESGGRVMEFRRGGELIDGEEKAAAKGEWKRIDEKLVLVQIKVRGPAGDILINKPMSYRVTGSELDLEGLRASRR